jgi:hypothetical protein
MASASSDRRSFRENESESVSCAFLPREVRSLIDRLLAKDAREQERLVSRSLISHFAGRSIAAGAVVFFSLFASRAVAADASAYRFSRSFNLPAANPASGGTVLFDALPDGRLLALNGASVSIETAVGSGAFASVGDVAGFAPSFGASFFTISPDGTKAAVGSNAGSVVVFNTATPATNTTHAVNDFEAAWLDNSRLAIANGTAAGTGVQILNTTTSALSSVIGNIGGFSGGVAVDAAGNLYAGNGFNTTVGGSDTGWVKAFTPAQVNAAIASGTPIDFEAAGTPIVDLLSGSTLGFDSAGNFYVGGGDFFGSSGDFGYSAVVDADAIAAALAGGASSPPVDSSSLASLLNKLVTPAAIGSGNAPAVRFNESTGELLVGYFNESLVSVYIVPEPSSLALIGLVGTSLLRRKRVAFVAAAIGSAGAASAAYTFDADDFAVEVVSSTGLLNTTLYNNPQSVLGRPTLKFNNSANPNVTDLRRAKLIEGVFNTGPAGEKLITTIAAGTQVTVRMGRPVTNDPFNPFGVDFIVFGNSFFAGSGGFVGDEANLNLDTLGGALFAENTKVSVSPDNVNWYTYDSGPYADSAFPTNSYLWNSTIAAWTDTESDPTLPVNPSLLASVAGKTAGNVLTTIYKGSAGGTGFDLAASGFSSIQYIKVEGLAGFAGGEVDAFADVRASVVVPEPATVGALVVGLSLARRRR